MFSRLLFLLTIALALGLGGSVFLAPWLEANAALPEAWSPLVSAFAHDMVVRRTALACSAGLLVTAWVFFRRPRSRNRKMPPNNIVGA